MIGPYREHTMTRAEARRRFPEGEFSEQAAERYVKWYNSQVLQEQDIVKLAAHTMVVAIYGSVRETKERQINIQRYAKNHRLIPENLPQDMSSADSLFFNELSFQYMAYIREGNYEGAVTAYNKIMQYTHRYHRGDFQYSHDDTAGDPGGGRAHYGGSDNPGRI